MRVMLTSQYIIINIWIIPILNYDILMMKELTHVIHVSWHFVVKELIQTFAFIKGNWQQRVKWEQTIIACNIIGILALSKSNELMLDGSVYEMRKLSRYSCVFWCSGVVMSIVKHQWVNRQTWMSWLRMHLMTSSEINGLNRMNTSQQKINTHLWDSWVIKD